MPVTVPPTTAPVVDKTEDRPYGFIFGGIHLTENGRVITSVAPTCVYSDMTGTHVQMIWKWLIENQTINAALMQFSGVVAKELNELGDTYFVETGRTTEKLLSEFGEILKKVKK